MKKILFILLFYTTSFAGFRFSDAPITENIDASVCHAVGSAYLANSLEYIGFSPLKSDVISFWFGLLWEVKDGFFPYEKHGWIGGEGFSFGDLTCNVTGVVSNRLFHYALKKVKSDKKHRRLSYDWSKENFICVK